MGIIERMLNKIKQKYIEMRIRHKYNKFISLYSGYMIIEVAVMGVFQTIMCSIVFTLAYSVGPNGSEVIQFISKIVVLPSFVLSLMMHKLVLDYVSFPDEILDVVVPKESIDIIFPQIKKNRFWIGMKITEVLLYLPSLVCIINYLMCYKFFDVFFYYVSFGDLVDVESRNSFTRVSFVLIFIQVFVSPIYCGLKAANVISNENDDIRRTQMNECFKNMGEVAAQFREARTVGKMAELGSDIAEDLFD